MAWRRLGEVGLPRSFVAPSLLLLLAWETRRRPGSAGCWMSEVQRSSKEGDVRVTTALNRMLGLPGAWVRDVAFGQEAVIVTVVLRARTADQGAS